jgi:ribosomal protein S18 acetylase RimI-like enzyme
MADKSLTQWLNDVKIRLLVSADLPALEWEGKYTHFRRIYAEAFERTKAGRSLIWVADYPGPGRQNGMNIIGQVFVQLICDRPELADGAQRAYIYAFRIRPAYRNGGLGAKMMAVTEADLYQRGFHTVTLNVAQDNPGGMRLYQRLGYQVVSADPGRWSYPDENGIWRQVEEPAWRMEKSLKSPLSNVW